MVSGPTVVLLGQDRTSTRILFHHLRPRFELAGVVLEDPVPRREFLARRAKRLGPATVAGQVMFQALVVPVLARRARARIEEIKRREELDDSPIEPGLATRVRSVNSDAARSALRGLHPDVIVLSGTRIVSAETMRSVPATFMNVHTGITPKYRGVHGGYWALAQRDDVSCGVTVHVVDEGVDTGPVLAQTAIAPTAEDSFVTYPLLQLAAALPHLERAIGRAAAHDLSGLEPPQGESRLWSHPTLVQYLATRRKAGIR
jgi:folate-dependent phosphoribosylglycinamide formyltransferase PurN